MEQMGHVEYTADVHYRIHRYCEKQLADIADNKNGEKNDKDYFVQDCQHECIEVSENAARLLDYI